MITDRRLSEQWLRETAEKQGQAPSELRLIRLKHGEFALVDMEDYPRIAARRWSAAPNGYATSGEVKNGRARSMSMHREVLGAAPGTRLDHRDQNKLNNTRANLRYATRSQNGANKKKRADGLFSAYRGVGRAPHGKPMAAIWVEGRREYLGVFETEEEAARAYDAAARHYWGEFANPNFPDAALTYDELLVQREAQRLAGKQCRYRGVTPQARCSTFKAAIRDGGSPIHLGSFRTAEEAALAYDDAARRLKGERAKLNFA